MGKNLRIIIVMAVVILAVFIFVAATRNHNNGDTSLQPIASPKDKSKIEVGSNACQKYSTDILIDKSIRNQIEQTAISHLAYVPAGTNVDVNVSSYSATETTGSVIYPKNYGSYNFKAVKKQSNWMLTSFQTCKQS